MHGPVTTRGGSCVKKQLPFWIANHPKFNKVLNSTSIPFWSGETTAKSSAVLTSPSASVEKRATVTSARPQLCVPTVALNACAFANSSAFDNDGGSGPENVMLAKNGPAGSEEIPKTGVGEPSVVGVSVNSYVVGVACAAIDPHAQPGSNQTVFV